MTLKYFVISLLLLVHSIDLFGQNEDRCASVEYNDSLNSQFPERISTEDFEKWMKQRIRELKIEQDSPRSENSLHSKYGIQTFTIPLIFHIIHDGEVIGNTPNVDAQYVTEQIEQLNLDFANLSGSAYPQAADIQIQFCAAKIDPQGNCLAEPGINRINRNSIGLPAPSYTWQFVNTSIKPITQWNPDEYANIWSLDLKSFLGFAQLPEASYLEGVHDQNGISNTDGIILKFSTIGSLDVPFPTNNPYNKGRTLTHEMGHWLGLRHLWGDGDCDKDDFCVDTPTQGGKGSAGCPVGNDTCTSDSFPDMVENYMDYTDDICMNTFTSDQRDRMLVVMDSTFGSIRRASLNNSPACDCAPIADFSPMQSNVNLCLPTANIQFNNESIRTYSNSSFSWTFSGAGVSPTSSTLENPTVTVSNNGIFTASLTVTTANGTDTKGPISITINTVSAAPNAVNLNSPNNTSTQNPLSPSLNWNAISSADSYFVEVATDQAMANIVYVNETVNTSIVVPQLNPITSYYWRVFSVNDCNKTNVYSGSSSAVWSFSTINTTCYNYSATDTPQVISTSGTPTVNSTITIPSGLGLVAGLKISKLSLEHSYMSDLTISLTNSSGVSALLVREICGSNDDLNLIFADNGSPNSNIPCPPTDGLPYQAQSPFTIYNGIDPAGTWTLSVSDAASFDGGNLLCWDLEICTEDVLVCPGSLSVSASGSNINCANQSTGSISANISGGVSPYTYIWQNSLGQSIGTTANLSNLPADTYTVFVSDANACIVSSNITLTQPSSPLANSFSISNVSCANAGDGSITNSTSGGTLPRSYNWSNGNTTNSINNLNPGNYSLTITDGNNCTIIENYTITEPPILSSTSSITPVNCAGGTDGEIQQTVSGGTLPYAYNWSNGMTTSDISNLTAGQYSLSITDGNNCTIIENYTITEPAILLSTSSITPVNCAGGTDGEIQQTVSGGTLPYAYNWSNGMTTSDISNLTAGQYSLSITDGNNCTIIENYTITEPSLLTSSVLVTSVNCAGGMDGEISLVTSGGTTPYTYNWFDGSSFNQITGLAAGSYDVTVTDNNQCQEIINVIVNGPNQQLSLFNQNHINVSCSGLSDGELDIQITGGTSPYTINWSNGSTTNIISNLAAGTYSVTVTDSNNCTTNNNWTITEPTALEASVGSIFGVSCNGGNDGQAVVTPLGGTMPYTYMWSSGETTTAASNLSAGNNSVTVTDMNTCSVIESFFIAQPIILDISIDQVIEETCINSNDGYISVSAIGGMGPHSYTWSNGSNGPSISNLNSGTYSVTIMDDLGCEKIDSITILEPSLNVNPTTTSPSCVGDTNGSTTVTVSGGNGPFTYLWPNGQTSATLSGVAAGSYSLEITDGNSCVFYETIIIPPAEAITIFATGSNLNCSSTNNGTLSAFATGGSGPYTYNWEDTTGNPVNTSGLAAGTYNLTVTDNNNCQAFASVTINSPVSEYTMSNGNMLTGNQLFTADFEVDGAIESNQYVNSTGNNIDYDSGTEITLKAGFEIQRGTKFHAFIDGCGGSM